MGRNSTDPPAPQPAPLYATLLLQGAEVSSSRQGPRPCRQSDAAALPQAGEDGLQPVEATARLLECALALPELGLEAARVSPVQVLRLPNQLLQLSDEATFLQAVLDEVPLLAVELLDRGPLSRGLRCLRLQFSLELGHPPREPDALLLQLSPRLYRRLHCSLAVLPPRLQHIHLAPEAPRFAVPRCKLRLQGGASGLKLLCPEALAAPFRSQLGRLRHRHLPGGLCPLPRSELALSGVEGRAALLPCRPELGAGLGEFR